MEVLVLMYAKEWQIEADFAYFQFDFVVLLDYSSVIGFYDIVCCSVVCL
jgi:hypothetical protein